MSRRELETIARQILPDSLANVVNDADFSKMRREHVNLKMQLRQFSETVSSFPSERRSANPAAAGGSAQPPTRNDNATPSSAAKPDHLPRGVVQGGRGDAMDDLTAAPAPSSGDLGICIEQGVMQEDSQIVFAIQEQAAINLTLSR